jgi:hypothetical protein
MYRACLFCHADLGANQTVEHLPVGRRIAFDSGKGRLWVVCRNCERWNLTPFDDRWEAMEECERLFRETRVRFSTDEIGLARLREGTELVRIGEPLRPEFAAWRYGDQFGRRRTRHLLMAGAGVTALVGLAIAPPLLGLSVGGGGGWQIYNAIRQMVRQKRVVARVPLEDGSHLALTQPQVEGTRLFAPTTIDSLRLRIPARRKAPIWRPRVPGELATLEGESARIALQRILPRVNHSGASQANVREAVQLLEQTPDPAALASRAAGIAGRSGLGRRKEGLATLPVQLRLALEMSSHEDAERRWLAGELLDLERAWRDAEELAAIADKLGIPEDVEARLDALRVEALTPNKRPPS